VKTRSDLTQISIHVGAAGTQTQIAVKSDAAVKDHPDLVVTSAKISSSIGSISQLPDRPPKVADLDDCVIVSVTNPQKSVRNSSSPRSGDIGFQARAGVVEPSKRVTKLSPVFAPIVSIVTGAIIHPATIVKLRRAHGWNRQN
jgi:hypothetical protein